MCFQMYSMNLETVIAENGDRGANVLERKRGLRCGKDVRKKRRGLMYHSGGGGCWIWVCLTMSLILAQTLAMKITPIGVGGGGGWGDIYVKGTLSGTMFYILKSDYLTFMDYSWTSFEYI